MSTDIVGKLRITLFTTAIVCIGGGGTCSLFWDEYHYSFWLDAAGICFAAILIGSFFGIIGTFLYEAWTSPSCRGNS